jgi:CRISPR system Cascade subunit CasA
MNSYDLIEQPWIECLDGSGKRVTLGLRNVLLQAPTLRGLAHESPLVDAALLRLLLAIAHRCFGPADEEAWRRLWDARRFDAEVVTHYFEEWQEKFDLFHPTAPFYQVANLVKQTANYERGKKPGREMIVEQSSYGAPRALFERRPEDASTSIPVATAARWLVALQAFHTGGLLTRDVANGDPTAAKAGPLCSSAVISIAGDNLFETLLLNLLEYPDSMTFPSSDDDRPCWEVQPDARYKKRACRGWLDWLTWQSRRIQLFGEPQDGVSEFILLSGVELLADEPPFDPMCAYRKNEKLGFLSIGFQEDKALWRDSVALFQTQKDDLMRGPKAVGALRRHGIARHQAMRLLVYGQVPNKASVVLTRMETIPLPEALVHQPELVGYIGAELTLAEEVQKTLRNKGLFVALGHVLSLGDRSPDPADVRNLIESTQAIPRFWAAMKPAFDEFVGDLSKDPDRAVTEFRKALRDIALATYESAVVAAASSARILKGASIGRATLKKGLAFQGLSLSKLQARDDREMETST